MTTVVLSATLLTRSPIPTAIAATIDPQSPPETVLDLDRVLATAQRARLKTRLEQLPQTSGFRVVLLTQNATNAPGMAAVKIFGLDARTALIVVDRRGGNVLGFRVGDALRERLPQSFWTELGNRYGNTFYVRDHGIDGALLDAVGKIETCLQPSAFCKVVPGLSQDQFYVGVASAALAGCIAGAAARTGGKTLNLTYLTLFSPLWSIFLVSFALGPLLQRQPGLSLELAGTLSAFALFAGGLWAWIPVRFGQPGQKGPDL